jgi:hypothetical protein
LIRLKWLSTFGNNGVKRPHCPPVPCFSLTRPLFFADLIIAWTGGEIEIWSGAAKKDLSNFRGYGEDFDVGQFNEWRESVFTSIRH